jgi:hypothetical protein
MDAPDDAIREKILEYISGDPRSISAISRYLEAEGVSMHRLILTGYLRAMYDFGYVKVREIPPSKVYQSAVPVAQSIYSVVGECVRSLDIRRSEQEEATVYILNRLFNRPVFNEEVEMCGFFKPLDVTEVEGPEVAEARRIVIRSGVKLPRNDPAYVVEDDHSETFNKVVSKMFVEVLGIESKRAGDGALELEGVE